MAKKSLLLFVLLIVLSGFVISDKIEVSTTKESFSAEEAITFTVSLYDSSNNLINDNINILIEDAEKRTQIEQTVSSGKVANANLGEGARAGLWTITASYQDIGVKEFFTIETNEEIKFEIQGDKLIVKNIGNTRYIKTIDILIGDSLGTKKVDLNVGGEASFRLIAPDGTYNIKVTDGKTTINKGNVVLTGKVIGILDEGTTRGSSPVTGGLPPGEEGEDFYGNKNRNYIYVFILVVIGAAVLLAVERNYRKKV